VKNVTFVTAKIEDDKADFSIAEEKMALYGDRVIGIKAYFDTKSPHVRSIKPLEEICAYARERGLKVMVHCSNSPTKMLEIVNTLSEGDILTHAYHGGKNNVSEDGYECIKEAKRCGVIIDAGFAGHIHTDFRVFEDAVKCGAVPDVISTDITRFSAYKRGGRYGMTMCMSVAREVGMSEEAIFRAVTSTPARTLGVEAGRLFEGCVADLCVIGVGESFSLTDKEGNTVQSDNGYKCLLTIKNGQILYRY
jgi:dihydroorotase